MSGDFLIAYGSHTGQAESIAGQIKERAELVGLKPRLFPLQENEKQFHIEKEPFVVIVVSSTGDGDPPENAARFLRRISRKSLETNFLQDVTYALLGLGDSNYSTYQGVPIKVDKQLQYLGATRILELGAADDQVGLELVVEPWIEKLFVELARRFSIDESKMAALTTSQKLVLAPTKTKEEKDRIQKEDAAKVAAKLEAMKLNGGGDSVEDDVDAPDSTAFRRPTVLQTVPYEYPTPSLVKGDEKLSADENLRVPIASQPFLCSSVSHEKHVVESAAPWQNGFKMVGVASAQFPAFVVGTALLTDLSVPKQKREIVVDIGEHVDRSYEPGDAFYFIAPNPEQEVNLILQRTGLLAVADQKCTVAVDPNTQKINPQIPGYIPPVSSLRHLLTNCLDIRRAPGRPLLRVLSDSATNPVEKRRLLELCSTQGMNDFTLFVRQNGLSVADILLAFPSVNPSIDRLLELLPRLMPRPYSVASAKGRRVRFVYSVMDFSAEDGRRYQRKGLASEWLLNLRVGDTIQMMWKEPARFRLPPLGLSDDAAYRMPLLMIGPGTGVAVFLAFCQHLLKKKLSDPDFPTVPRYFYFGCRNFEKDYIYRDELESYVREGVLTGLYVAESQGSEGRPIYVQNALQQNIKQVCEFLSLSDGPDPSRVFICGDAKGMSKDVWACFHELVKEGLGKSEAEAKAYMLDLKKADRYVEDVWS